MVMFWNIRRRPSKGVRVLRSVLIVSAAVFVPVGVGVIRRLLRQRGGAAENGRPSPARMEPSARRGTTSGSRRKRSRIAGRASAGGGRFHAD